MVRGRIHTFPAPLEVDRYLYYFAQQCLWQGYRVFPAPLEVDRYLYVVREKFYIEPGKGLFPAPREVDRFLYL